jgi:hypothetical protein
MIIIYTEELIEMNTFRIMAINIRYNKLYQPKLITLLAVSLISMITTMKCNILIKEIN